MIPPPSSVRTALVVLCLVVVPRAGAQAESLALACPVCHGAPATDAAHAPSAVPSFYGRPAREIASQLRDFRAGSRQSSAMSRLAHSLTDAEIDTLATTYGAPE